MSQLFEWYLWGESLAKTGFTGTTSKAGYPDVYTYTGDICQLRNLPNPYFVGGFATGVTKTGGARFKGDLSYGTTYTYLPGLMRDFTPELWANHPPKLFQKGENLTGESDSAAVNEVTLIAALFDYGNPHTYPRTLNEIMAMIPRPRKIHTPQFSVTSAGAITSGSGAVALDTASQEDNWINKESNYYILGAIPHLVNNAGLLQFNKGGLPNDTFHQHLLPLARGAQPVSFDSGGISLPYRPIGPFSASVLPTVGLFSTAAVATTFALILAEM